MHVHVKNGDGKAKINIETAEVVENTGIKPADMIKVMRTNDMESIVKLWFADGRIYILTDQGNTYSRPRG